MSSNNLNIILPVEKYIKKYIAENGKQTIDSTFGKHKSYDKINNNENIDLTDAINLVTEVHKNDKRKDIQRTPYIEYLIEVCNIIKILFNNVEIPEGVLEASILLDVVKKGFYPFKDLKEKFSENVIKYIVDVNDKCPLTKHTSKQLQVKEVNNRTLGAKMIIVGEKICNLYSNLFSQKLWTPYMQICYGCWVYKLINSIEDIPNKELIISIVKDICIKLKFESFDDEYINYNAKVYYIFITI